MSRVAARTFELGVPLLAMLLVQPVSLAAAQGSEVATTSASPADEARISFEEGTRALREGRYADAVVALERSHALLPNVPNAFNLAVALLRAQQPLRALVILRALEDGLHGPLADAQQAAVTERVTEALGHVAQLEVVVHRPAGGDGPVAVRVDVDGASAIELTLAPGQTASRRIELEPGDHTLVVTAPPYLRAERSFAATAGSSSRTAFDLGLAATEGDAVAPAGTAASSIDETALWVGILTGVVVLTAGAVTVGVLVDQAQPRPVVDPVTGIAETLIGTRIAF